jgi:phosphoribosylaminoimidazolecarboxamide formyltransferase/IMP cyclohydrolase
MGVRNVRRAIFSVSDRTGIDDFGRRLAACGVELLASGGTGKALRDAGLETKDVSEITGFPEMMDGRVKTLHPRIHGGLLARRDVPEHLAQADTHDIPLIDLAVLNLYPFEKTVADPQVTLEEAVEQIDIGGPALVRSSAKNFASVAVVVDPADYDEVASEIESTGAVSDATRRRLCLKAFRHTAHYDQTISEFLGSALSES